MPNHCNLSWSLKQLPMFLITLLTTFAIVSCGGGGSDDSDDDDDNASSYSVGDTTNLSLGGKVTGLSGSIMLENAGEQISLNQTGEFTFAGVFETGNSYEVTIAAQPANQTCSVNLNAGVFGVSNISAIDVTCANPESYEVIIDVPITLSGAIIIEESQSSIWQSLKTLFLNMAYADPIANANIQVVRIDDEGSVNFVFDTTSTSSSEGLYTVTVDSPPLSNVVFIAASETISIGDSISKGVYSIAYSTSLQIDVASTVTVNELIEETDDFAVLTIQEVSKIVESAQDIELSEPSDGQDLSSYISDIAEPAIAPIIANDILDAQDVDQLTMGYLAGKTLYNVWYGSVDDANNNELPGDNAGLDQLDFNANGLVVSTNLLYGNTETIRYTVGSNGLLRELDESDRNGTKIVCGGTSQFLKTHYIANGAYENTDLFFFNEADARAFQATLNASIPPCAEELPISTIPSATIIVDGSIEDWSNIGYAAQDLVSDQDGNSSTDIVSFKVAFSAGNMALLLETNANILFPHTPSQEYSHYEISVHANTDAACENGLGYVIANNFTHSFNNTTINSLDIYPNEGVGSQTTTSYAASGSYLETTFALTDMIPGTLFISFSASIQSFDSNGNSTSHDNIEVPGCFSISP